MAKSQIHPSQLGCGFLIGNGILLILLLWLNTVFVRMFFSQNFARVDERVFNAAQFLLPIILLFIEYWLFDAVRDFFRFRSRKFD